jgi:hypothetical protein
MKLLISHRFENGWRRRINNCVKGWEIKWKNERPNNDVGEGFYLLESCRFFKKNKVDGWWSWKKISNPENGKQKKYV